MKYIPYAQRFGFSESNSDHLEVDDSCKDSGHSMELSISEMPIQTAFKEKVAKIDDKTYSKIIDNLLDNQGACVSASSSTTPPISESTPQKHQLINQSHSTIEENSATEVEPPPQCENQPPNFETVKPHQSSVTSNEQFTVTNDQSKVSNLDITDKGEDKKTELVRSDCTLVTDIEWLMKVLEDLEKDNSVHTANEWLELLSEAEQKINTTDGFDEQYPDYWPRIWAAFPDSSDKTESPPTLDELKSLLLACQTWVQLKQVQKQHPEQAKVAYTALTSDEQRILDAIAATEVDQDVYKYVGPQRKYDGVEIEPGTLVYLDPESTNKNRPHLKVRLLQGINQGWQKVVEISKDALLAVEKAVNDGLDAIEPQQGNLLDELS